MTEVTDEEVEAARLAIIDVMQLSSPTPLEMARAAIEAYNSTPGQEKMREDAERYRWLTEDLTGAQKDARNELLERMSVMSYSAASRDIDAARAAEDTK